MLSSRSKGSVRFNFSFFHNGGENNLVKQRSQENTAANVDVVPKKKGVINDYIKCYACKTLGHYTDQFPSQTCINFTQTDIMLLQG